MTTGTKIFLAVFALIVGILVVYYGMIVPGKNSTGNREQVAAGNGGAAETKKSDAPREHAGAVNGGAPFDRRTSPPPRDPAPIAPQTTPPAATMPSNATGNGGLLSEGVREATGDSINMSVQPGGNGRSPIPADPHLPLVTLNNGNLRSTGDDSPAEGVAPVAQQPEPVPAKPPAQPATTNPVDVGPTPLEPMPERNPAPAPPPTKPAGNSPVRMEYFIAQGDTFVSIAEEWFGNANKWGLIARENPTVDPQKLKIGQRIFLPPKEAANSPATPDPVVSAGETIYVVQSGDTLIAIARDHLGDGARWESIYELNKATIGLDSAALKVGMKIKLPKK
jgi:nucleoid-associated protein YgaU